MNIGVAKSAGFCFGVDRAIQTVNNLLEGKKSIIYTLGPIIHNKQLVKNLEAEGVRVVEDIEDLEPPGFVVIRAHGVTPQTYEAIRERGLDIIDVTCPYVKKIHRLVQEKYREGCMVIIVGDSDHPEVKGINGWCSNSAYIVNCKEDIDRIEDEKKDACVVAQTTITHEKWQSLTGYIDKRFENVLKFDTICAATTDRQAEGLKLAKRADVMIVIGGYDSSNTHKLYEICKNSCEKTYKIETIDDLPSLNIKQIKNIGITAGASTPDWIIKEVVDRMEELNMNENDANANVNVDEQQQENSSENEQKKENEKTFQEALDDSMVSIRTGKIVTGKIIGFNENEIYVDLGYKSDGTVPIEEYSKDENFNPEKDLKVGDEIDVYVVKVDDKEGTVRLSKKKVDDRKGWNKIKKAYNDKTPVEAKVIEIVKGGVLTVSKGIRIFIPASHLSDRYIKDLNEFSGKNVTVRIIEFNRKKGKVIGSRRVLIEEEKEKKVEELWEGIEEGREYTGKVTGITDFGAFVDIGGVDGLIHLTELSWTNIKHPSEVISMGDTVKVRVLDFDREKERISLGYRKDEDNPWKNVDEEFSAGDIVKGKIVRLVPFGAFVELMEGVDGLVHISQISSRRIVKPEDVLKKGQEVEAKVLEVDEKNQRISLSIKEVNPIDPPKSEEEQKTAEKKNDRTPGKRTQKKAEKTVSRPKTRRSKRKHEDLSNSHTEEMSIKIGDMLGHLNLEEHVQGFDEEKKINKKEPESEKPDEPPKEDEKEKPDKETKSEKKNVEKTQEKESDEKKDSSTDVEEPEKEEKKTAKTKKTTGTRKTKKSSAKKSVTSNDEKDTVEKSESAGEKQEAEDTSGKTDNKENEDK